MMIRLYQFFLGIKGKLAASISTIVPGTTIPTMWLRMLDAPLDVRCGFLSDRSNQIDAAALARDEGDPASGADDRGWYQGCSEQKAERGGEEGMEHAPRALPRIRCVCYIIPEYGLSSPKNHRATCARSS